MEKERFDSIHKTFNYTSQSVFTNQWPNLVFGVGMIVAPLMFPFGVRIRRLHILSPTVFYTILIIGGALLLLLTFYEMRTAHTLAEQGGIITVDGKRGTYPIVGKNKVEYDTYLISDINMIKDDDKENKCKVDLPDKFIIFDIKYFDSYEQFEEFRELLG